MTFYVVIFIVGGLLGPMLLGIALGQRQIFPAWAAWLIIIHSPLLVAAFISHFHPQLAEIVTYSMLLIGCIPVASAMLRFNAGSGGYVNLPSSSTDNGAKL